MQFAVLYWWFYWCLHVPCPPCETKIVGHKKIKWRLYPDKTDSTKLSEEIVLDTVFVKKPHNILDTLWGNIELNAIFYIVTKFRWCPRHYAIEPYNPPCMNRREDTIIVFGKRTSKLMSEVRITKRFCDNDTIVIKNAPIIFNEKKIPLIELDTVLASNNRDISFILKINRKYDKKNRIIEEKHIVTDDGYLYNWYKYEYTTIQE